ncbi:MAG: hypothetical protein ACLFVW_02655 [Phycisphaerae bacterium]
MFALLAGATLSAWLIVQRRTGPHNRGEKVVGRLHEKGLSTWWERSTQARWFLVRRGDRAVGWQVHVRVPLDDGGFGGFEIRILRRDGVSGGSWEGWVLNSDATAGEYRAGEVGVSGERVVTSLQTYITLSEGTIQAEQQIPIQARSKARAPKNYIPEGTLSLVRRLTAETGDDAAFRMVFNEQPPRGSRTSFGTVRMETQPVSQQQRREGATQAMKMTFVRADGQENAETYLLDEQGETLAIVADNTRVESAEAREVLTEFPDAPRTVAHLNERLLERFFEQFDTDDFLPQAVMPPDVGAGEQNGPETPDDEPVPEKISDPETQTQGE